jgi:hypothetical protein
MKHFCVSEVARQIGARPKDISDLFYQRWLDDQRCPLIGGRRLIPEDYVPFVEKALLDFGRPLESNVVDIHKEGDEASSEDKGGNSL